MLAIGSLVFACMYVSTIVFDSHAFIKGNLLYLLTYLLSSCLNYSCVRDSMLLIIRHYDVIFNEAFYAVNFGLYNLYQLKFVTCFFSFQCQTNRLRNR